MDTKLLIRSTAIKLLEKIYLESDCYLKATIDAFEFINDEVDKTLIQKAGLYLSNKGFIETSLMACDKWVVMITVSGIDWLEDNRTNNPKWLI